MIMARPDNKGSPRGGSRAGPRGGRRGRQRGSEFGRKAVAGEAHDEAGFVVVPPTEEAIIEAPRRPAEAAWKPKTELGSAVHDGRYKDMAGVFQTGQPILEYQIIDVLVPNIESDLLMIGQSKGKFGGGQRRVFKQTQKKTNEGNKPSFATCAVIGNKNGLIGVGYGKAKETVPAREKALRDSKLNAFHIRRGCGSWQCGCKEPHSIPFKVLGKCGSIRMELMPAPKGSGLRIQKECQKILRLAGIQDVWSHMEGHSASTYNVILACVSALRQLMLTKVATAHYPGLGIVDGSITAGMPEEKQDIPGATANEESS